MAPQPLQPDGKTFVAAVTTVAAVYVYFLIFAQFGLLKAVHAAFGEDAGSVRPLLATMGMGGILGSIAAARFFAERTSRHWLVAGFATCAVAAGGSLGARGFAGFGAVALLAGLGAGVITVTLAGMLRRATGERPLGIIIGLGTGLAYGFCNLPGIFDASAKSQASWGIAAALIGGFAGLGLRPRFQAEVPAGGDYSRQGVVAWVLVFLALVCLDSALFYFIQHSPKLKDALWGGAGQQALNAAMHLIAATLAGWALDRGWLGRTVLMGAVAVLGAGVWMSGAGAGLIYIAGVSAYSTALVFYPARGGRPGLAALVYAVAGWGGSALGIGLAEGRETLPIMVMVSAATALAAAWGWRHFASHGGGQ